MCKNVLAVLVERGRPRSQARLVAWAGSATLPGSVRNVSGSKNSKVVSCSAAAADGTQWIAWRLSVRACGTNACQAWSARALAEREAWPPRSRPARRLSLSSSGKGFARAPRQEGDAIRVVIPSQTITVVVYPLGARVSSLCQLAADVKHRLCGYQAWHALDKHASGRLRIVLVHCTAWGQGGGCRR